MSYYLYWLCIYACACASSSLFSLVGLKNCAAFNYKCNEHEDKYHRGKNDTHTNISTNATREQPYLLIHLTSTLSISYITTTLSLCFVSYRLNWQHYNNASYMRNEIEWKKLYQNHTNAHIHKAIRHECIYAVHMNMKCSQWIASRIWREWLLLLMLCVSTMHMPWFLDCFANINLPTEPTANSKQPNIWFFYLFCNFMLCSSHFCLRHLCKCHFFTLQIVWIVCGRARSRSCSLGVQLFYFLHHSVSCDVVIFCAILNGISRCSTFSIISIPYNVWVMCLPCSPSIYRTIFY